MRNNRFSGGWYHPGGVAELQIPDEWVFADLSGTPNPIDPAPHSAFVRPEVRVLSPDYLPPAEWPVFVSPENTQVLKAFKGYGAWYSSLSQNVELAAGNYVAIIEVFPDLVNGYDANGKVWAEDPLSARVRVLVDGQAVTEWVNLIAGSRVTLRLPFTTNGGGNVTFEFMLPFPLNNSGLFISRLDVESAESTPEPPTPALDYPVTVELLPQDATLPEIMSVVEKTFADNRTFMKSAGDAAYLVSSGAEGSCVNVWSGHRWPGDIDAYLRERGVTKIVHFMFESDELPPVPPSGYDYPVLDTGSKLHPHAVAESGTYDLLEYLSAKGYMLPFVKLALAKEQDLVEVTNLQALSPGTQFIVRLQEINGCRAIETPNFRTGSAADYMAMILPFMAAYPQVAYWELWNEIDPGDTAGHVALANFACACMDIANAHGVKLALMSYSTGMPEPGEWQAIWNQTQLFPKAKAGGHILSLHAYGNVADPGDLRYHLLRPLYELYEPILTPNDCMIPYVFSEYNISSPPIPIGDWLGELAAMDDLLAEQYYCLGAAIFTFGAAIAWPNHNMDAYWQPVADLIYATMDRQNAVPTGETQPPVPEPEPELQILDIREQLPQNTLSPWYPWAQRTLSEITHIFVHHSAGAASSSIETVRAINAYHISPTGKNRPGICYTYLIGADGIIWHVSNIENVVFSQGSVDHPGDENRYGLGICLLGSFISGREPTAAQMQSLEKLIAHVEKLTGRKLLVWGHKDVASTQCPGDSWPFKPEWGRGAQVNTLVGFNDYPGTTGTALDWMNANGKSGLIVRPIFLGGNGAALSFAGSQRVLVDLCYSWSTDMGGAGTLPLPGTPEWSQFVNAAIYTINNSTGVWGWIVGNEFNNQREFPSTGNLTPQVVAQTYNAIRNGCPGKRMAVGALDPFNAVYGDPRNWMEVIYNGITGAEFVAMHGYIRGPDASLVGSTAKFSDDPLRWQFLNFPGCITELLKSLLVKYQSLPVYCTEFNHLWRTVEPDFGWVNDARATAVARAAIAAARNNRIEGLAFYRWAGDQWELEHNIFVKSVV